MNGSFSKKKNLVVSFSLIKKKVPFCFKSNSITLNVGLVYFNFNGVCVGFIIIF